MNWIFWIVSILFGTLLAFFVYRKDKQKDIPVKWLPALLRGIVGTLAALLLLAPVFSGLINKEEKPTLIWLQDISTSTKNALGGFESKFKTQEQQTIAQLEKKYKVQTFGFGASLTKDSIYNYNQKATDVASTLEQISTQFQDKNIGAIILASDGIYNQGNNPLYLDMARPIPIYTIALGDSTTPKDLIVNGVYANKTVALNSSFEVFADITASGLSGTQTTATLTHQGKTTASQNISINSNDFASSISFAVEAKQAGVQQYSVSFSKTGTESNIQNNAGSVIVEVKERKTKVILVSHSPHPDIGVIKQALKDAAQFELKLILNGNLPENINTYDILIAYQFSPKTDITIPTWHIMGTLSTPQSLANLSKITSGLGFAGSRDVMAQLQPNFSQFNLPANIRVSLPKMPPLTTNVTGLKAGEQTILTDQQGNAIWNYYPGALPQSILNGEGLWRWAMYEFKNFKATTTTHELIRQTLNFLQIDKDNKPFKISVLKNNITDNESAVIIAELRNPNGELINEPEAKLSLTADGKTLQYNFEKSGNAYRLQAGLLAPGSYQLKGSTTWKGKAYEDYSLLHVNNIPLEALRSHADYGLLFQLAQQHNGLFFTQYNFPQIVDSIANNNKIKTIIHSQTESKPIINKKWLFFLIIVLASIEWFLRKFWSL